MRFGGRTMRPNESTPLECATDLLARGLAPIPIPYKTKAPAIVGWQRLRLTADDLPRYFNGQPLNIGTLLGEPAGWLIDVDLDHPRAVELADSFLPHTDMVWGRAGNPGSHRLYRVSGPLETRKWMTSGRAMVVELRSTGCQTVAPGSIHPSGEAIRWDADGEASTVDPAELIAAVEALAGAVLAELGEEPTKPAAGPAPRQSTAAPAKVLERAAAYLARIPGAVAGSGGHNQTYAAATAMVHGFGLEPDVAFDLLRREYNPRCSPPWTDKELRHKVDDAASRAHAKPRGWLLDAKPPQPTQSDAAPGGLEAAAEAPEWNPPTPLAATYPAPPFPLAEAFPPALAHLAEYCAAMSNGYQVPVDLPAMGMLAVGAAAGAKKFEVEPREQWREVMALFVMALSASGERKSQTLTKLMAPVVLWERDEAERLEDEIEQQQDRIGYATKRREHIQNKAAKGTLTTQEENDLASIKETLSEDVIVAPRLWTGDATTEALCRMMIENGERGFVASAEADALDVMLGRYSDKGNANMGIWLKGHCGDPERIVRMGRPTQELVRPTLSVCLFIQPDAAEGVFSNAQANGRGLIPRFLCCAPQSRIGYRLTGKAVPRVPTELEAMYGAGVRRLLDMPLPEGPAAAVRMDAAATDMFEAFEAVVERRMRPDGDLADFASWASKLCGAIARIALVLHCYQHGAPASYRINTATMAAALAWAPYLIESQRRVSLVVGADKAAAGAMRLLRWLGRQGLTEFSKRDAFTGCRSANLQRSEEMDAALELLAEHGYIRPIVKARGQRGGRPPSDRFLVNPMAHDVADEPPPAEPVRRDPVDESVDRFFAKFGKCTP